MDLVAKNLVASIEEVKLMIYELIGARLIKGVIVNDEFQLTSESEKRAQIFSQIRQSFTKGIKNLKSFIKVVAKKIVQFWRIFIRWIKDLILSIKRGAENFKQKENEKRRSN